MELSKCVLHWMEASRLGSVGQGDSPVVTHEVRAFPSLGFAVTSLSAHMEMPSGVFFLFIQPLPEKYLRKYLSHVLPPPQPSSPLEYPPGLFYVFLKFKKFF